MHWQDSRPTEVRRLAELFAAEPELIQAFIEADGPERLRAPLIRRAAMESLSERPGFADLCYFAARAALHDGDEAAAEQLLRRAVAINPKFKDALILAARLAIGAELPERAEWLLQQALAAGGDYPDVHFLLGQAWQKQGLIGRARESYERALALNERYAPVRAALADLNDRGMA